MKDRFDDLVGGADDLPPEERDRLRRMHELLLAVDAPAEVPEALREAPPGFPTAAPVERAVRRRPRLRVRPAFALAAALLAVLAFGSGYLLGDRNVEPVAVIEMKGAGPVRDASGSIELLPDDESGNWPMRFVVRGLEPSANREDYYELWLTKGGKLAESCGRFTVHEGVTTVTLSVPYRLRAFDEWVVTRHGSDEVLLATSGA
jgi:hypothetical protein